MKKMNKACSIHINKVLKAVDTAKIRSNKFKVVIDSCNGAGSAIGPKLLKKLGCGVIEINTNMKKPFPHGPEPTPENLKELCRKVKTTGADIGFALDPDADRLSLVTNSGKAISEEYTVALAAGEVLSKAGNKKKIVVVNLSTSSLVDDIAEKYKAKVLRTKIGEVYVAVKMKEVKAIIGGEGNGGVIYPKVCYNRDSLSGMALILNLLADTGKSLDKIVADLPVYHLNKSKIDCASVEEARGIIKKVERIYKNEKMDKTEGVKIYLKDAWIHVRASNTEPIVRIFCEAKTESKAEEIIVPLVNKFQK